MSRLNKQSRTIKKRHQPFRFNVAKRNPLWIEQMKQITWINEDTKVLMAEGGTGSGCLGLINTIKPKNLTAISENVDDFKDFKKVFRKQKLPIISSNKIISKHLGSHTSYPVIINDVMGTPYGSEVHPERGHDHTWHQALQQQIPKMFIWNCYDTRIRHGCGALHAIRNIEMLFHRMCDNAGYKIVGNTNVGFHKSTPMKPGARQRTMAHNSFHIQKIREPKPDYVKLNAKLIATVRQLKTECPSADWILYRF